MDALFFFPNTALVNILFFKVSVSPQTSTTQLSFTNFLQLPYRLPRSIFFLTVFRDPAATMEAPNNQQIVEALTKSIEGLNRDVERINRRISELKALRASITVPEKTTQKMKRSLAPVLIEDFGAETDTSDPDAPRST
ncbi:uncharacterized protein NECHADRAFT_83318 [Fusarium vanettenii 77-13-4]|uniref:Uncharacterized protein n=1 Tax=Fusarium vanettenii (strain ATCC MYA-4622 / CBS 123669 / FGSC 9596 / NRRL 45880 / 77-13-4) TaxID=660122 RepID=C7Z3P0_FUSV7|nr:uncharacterized protein NECHADRAFT_83318 [Fusarium vanettenii 77-13-4]EEU41342.1 hypothetical protein NECHADRAFT_83318 [Fusarium vanettenii 77-13-4]